MGRYLKGPFPLGYVLCTYERPLEIEYNTIQLFFQTFCFRYFKQIIYLFFSICDWEYFGVDWEGSSGRKVVCEKYSFSLDGSALSLSSGNELL